MLPAIQMPTFWARISTWNDAAHQAGQGFDGHLLLFIYQNLHCPMKFEYNLSIGECILSFLMMMAVIIVGIFSGQAWLAVFGLPLFLRGLMGWCPLKTILNNSKSE